MLTKTLLALSLITGSTFTLNSYQPRFKTSSNPQQIVTQLPQQEIETIARNITVKVRNAENEGSGILIAKDNNTYTAITNASLTDGENYTIQTPDGMKHEAIVTGDNPENDLAILEFTSDEQYQTATIGNTDVITPGETVIAAGFPESKEELLVTEGKISLLTEKPLNKGYSIGFTNETVQGMSGGVLLNANGEVIGVLGKGKGAILDTAYDYADGTTPTDEEIATFREVAFSIPIVNIANLSPQLAALVPGESNPDIAQQPEVREETLPQKPEYTGIVKTVDDIAEQITVRIATPNLPYYGSGVIIAKDGNTYYVATVAHNFPEGTTNSYQIVTNDGESHQLDLNTVKKSDAYDFALFSFTSEKDYTVATIGNYPVSANSLQTVFVSGFPKAYLPQMYAPQILIPQRIITGGIVIPRETTSFITKDSFSFKGITTDRPGLLYSNLSYKGMSGGAVLDSEGRLVGINAGAENEDYFDEEGDNSEIALGFSLGIPLTDVLTFLERDTELKTEWLQITQNPAKKLNSNDFSSIGTQLLTVKVPKDDTDLADWMNYGNHLWRYFKSDEAIAAFEKVVAIDPNYDKAYYTMGLAYLYLQEWEQGVTALQKATQINPNPYYYWRWLGFLYRKLKQYDESITAYDKAISKNPEDFVLYSELGDTLREARRYERAIQLYDRAISINPNLAEAYNSRGTVYGDLQQYQQALGDFDQAISINPNHAKAYRNRGSTYYELKQYQQALSDFTQAISINPNYANAYYSRGLTYDNLQQYQQAISDYDRAIEIDPNYAEAYNNRGTTYRKLEQYPEAIADFERAIEINPKIAEPYVGLGDSYLKLNNIEEARINLEKARQLFIAQNNTAGAETIASLLEQLP